MRNVDLPTITIGQSLELPYALKEALNNLRINLTFSAGDAKVIMLTSSTASEGKSFVSIHLLKVLAESGKRVCLVDTDMRRSTLVRDYLMSSGQSIRGLSHYLSGQSNFGKVLYRIENIERAYVVPCGAYVIDPTILLENSRFKVLMENLRNNFDYVLVDCAPVGLVSDAKFISQYCDGALMVIRSGVVTGATVQNTARQIKESGCHLIGYILNGASNYEKQYYYESDTYNKKSDINKKSGRIIEKIKSAKK